MVASNVRYIVETQYFASPRHEDLQSRRRKILRLYVTKIFNQGDAKFCVSTSRRSSIKETQNIASLHVWTSNDDKC